MKPGERVRLIKECADSLATREHGEMQLVLQEFGFKTWDDQYLDNRDYCIASIREGTDDELLQLHAYLMGEDAGPSAPDVSDVPWADQPLRLFFSHVHEDRVFVGKVKRLMADRFGTDVFVAHDDISPSKRWREVIKAGLNSCDALLALWHPRFHESQWCDQEVGWALGRNIPVVPIRPPNFDRSAVRDGFMEEHHDFTLPDLHEWYVATRVLPVLLQDKRTHDKAFAATVEALVGSSNFNHTRSLWQHIEREPVITSDQLRRLEYAVETNDQVYKANVSGTPLPDLVKALVERFEPPAPSDPWDEPPF